VSRLYDYNTSLNQRRYSALNDSATSFPSEFATYRVLPSLVSALEFGGASAASIVPLLLRLGKNVDTSEYQTAVLGPVVKLYANPDRGIRMALLDNLSEYSDKLDKKTVSDKIWPHLVSSTLVTR
jgi:SCY1-like protein 1